MKFDKRELEELRNRIDEECEECECHCDVCGACLCDDESEEEYEVLNAFDLGDIVALKEAPYVQSKIIKMEYDSLADEVYYTLECIDFELTEDDLILV